MARTAITVVSADNTSLVPTAADAINGHSYGHSANRVLIVKNADSAAKTVTIQTPGTVAGNAIADYAVVVAAGATVMIDTHDSAYRQPADGQVYVDLSAATSVTLGVLDLS